MATVTAFVATDMTASNLSLITSNIVGSGAYTNITFNGVVYPTAVEVDWNYGGASYASVFLGNGITTQQQNGNYAVTGGTVTAFVEYYFSAGAWKPVVAIEGMSYSALSLYNAAQTASTADDTTAYNAILSGADTIKGSSGADVLFGAGGNDVIDGGNGVDTVVFTGAAAQYTVTQTTGGGLTVSDSVAGRNGVDTLQNVEQLRFSDYTLVFDLTSSQDSLVYRLYQAAFARTPDNGGFRYWAAFADQSQASAMTLADQFLAAPEFTQKYGSPDNTGFVTAMYTNVLGRSPDAAGLAYWVDQVNHGMPRDQLLVAFAISAENVQLTGAHMSNGYWTLS